MKFVKEQHVVFKSRGNGEGLYHPENALERLKTSATKTLEV